MSQPRQSITSLNYKVANIEHYLASIERDMSTLTEEEAMWRQQHEDWSHQANRKADAMGNKLQAQLKQIGHELHRRDTHCRQQIKVIDSKIVHIQTLQKQSANKIMELRRRLQDVEEILGNH